MPKPAATIEERKTQLDTFLAKHPFSSLEVIEKPKNCISIVTPWGDDTIGFQIPPGASGDELIATLNSVFLPERFSALYHEKSRQLEVIFTAYPLKIELEPRRFEFLHDKRKHICEYRRSSDELLKIADNFFVVAPPDSTNFRNLPSFQRYQLVQKGKSEVVVGEPLSFWISDLDWDDTYVMDLVNHLNFYMVYYDSSSPRILMHSPKGETVARNPQTRFAFEKFPSTITTGILDDILLHFWHASMVGDPAKRYLHSYQILEYSAYYYLEDSIKKRVRRELSAPNVLDNIPNVTEAIIDIFAEIKMHDHQKLHAMIKNTVNYKLIWRELQNNIEYFSKPVIFDGGFTVEPLVRSEWTEKDFEVNWAQTFSGTIRNIRNGLSHAKEERMATVIMPTSGNYEKLKWWVPLVSIAAAEVMIYRSVM